MRDCVGFEGLYAVTSCGKVWSYRSKKFLSPYDSQGYKQVDLYIDGQRYKRKVHRLVAEAYIPNPEGKREVDHIDRNRYRNDVNNLRWVTSAENKANSNVGKTKTHCKVRCIETGQVFADCAEAARSVGVHQYSINLCVLGKIKTCANYHWEYITAKEDE